MKSSYLVAGLFFKKVCLVSVPWCSRNTCLVYSCICALDLGFSCYFQDLVIKHVKINLKYLLKPRRSHDFLSTGEHNESFSFLFTWVYICIYILKYLYTDYFICMICLYVCKYATKWKGENSLHMYLFKRNSRWRTRWLTHVLYMGPHAKQDPNPKRNILAVVVLLGFGVWGGISGCGMGSCAIDVGSSCLWCRLWCRLGLVWVSFRSRLGLVFS